MERFNPWWRGDPDPAYEGWKKLRINWIPTEISKLSLAPFSLNFISGSRQVGKTTMIKLLIHQLLKKSHRNSIFYYSCDELSDYRELSEVLKDYLGARGARNVRSSFIFLDEVTFVHDWWRAVKAAIDQGSVANDVITITGSASLELLKQKERFPGRRGKGTDVVLRPLGFRSYVKALSKLEPLAMTDLFHAQQAIEGNRVYDATLESRFHMYLTSGGFPLAVREMVEEGAVGEGSRKAFLDGLRTDWLRSGKSEGFMKEVIGYVAEARGTPVSWLSISKATSIGSPNTARSYVETLEDLMVLLSAKILTPQGNIIGRKNKKLHFVDPFIYTVLSDYAGVKADEAAVVESTVSSHLARMHEVFHWRNKSEVDMVLQLGREQLGIEVKWGFKTGSKPRHIRNYLSLDRKSTPAFLASLPFA